MTIDWTKPIETLDGNPAEVLTTSARNARYPVVALAELRDGQSPCSFTPDGRLSVASQHRFIRNVPANREVWVNIYPGLGSSTIIHPTKAAADECAGERRIACVRVSFTEGDGLDKEPTP